MPSRDVRSHRASGRTPSMAGGTAQRLTRHKAWHVLAQQRTSVRQGGRVRGHMVRAGTVSGMTDHTTTCVRDARHTGALDTDSIPDDRLGTWRTT